MEEIELSKFQNNVHSIIDSIIHSHQPVLIRDEERLLVKIVPFSYSIISPAEDADNWKVLSQ